MDINHDIHDLQTEFRKPPIPVVSRIKYNPAERALKGISEDIAFFRGDTYVYDSSFLQHALDESATSSPQLDVKSANQIASEFETSITKHRKIWEIIPGIEDYFELDALNNVEEVEGAYYRASEEYGW